MALADVPIRRKTLIILMATSGAVGLLTCLLFFGYDALTFRKNQIHELFTLGEVIANNSTAAVAFDNQEDAENVLRALAAEPHITQAALYDKNGKLFAKYPSNLPDSSFPSSRVKDGLRYENSRLIAYQPVAEGKNKRLGTLYLKSDLGAVYERLRLYGGIVFIVLIISLIAGYGFSSILERRISLPILKLAETAKAVAHRRDYSVRAEKSGTDEVGLLTDAINLMLTRIGEQNNALHESEDRLKTLNQELEKRVEKRTKQLEEANKELESFSYSVSHDLRAPLRHIGGFADLLSEHTSGKLDEQATRYLSVISGSATKMANLIDDILEFSRMGRKEMMKSTVNLEELVKDIIPAIQAEYQDHNIEWIKEKLPEVIADASMLRQVFTNLLSNAVKYSKRREVSRVEMGAMNNQEEMVVLFVRDNGVGFDMKYATKLFGVFQRLHRSEEFEGTGIGLANAARIIQRHGGRIWAEAEPDQGATFYFSLPKQN